MRAVQKSMSMTRHWSGAPPAKDPTKRPAAGESGGPVADWRLAGAVVPVVLIATLAPSPELPPRGRANAARHRRRFGAFASSHPISAPSSPSYAFAPAAL